MTGLIILAIIVAVIGYAIFLYNDLVSKRQLKEEGWSGIDVQLKRRTDLIPNLMETVKGYMGHERDTLEAVVKARAAGNRRQCRSRRARQARGRPVRRAGQAARDRRGLSRPQGQHHLPRVPEGAAGPWKTRSSCPAATTMAPCAT